MAIGEEGRCPQERPSPEAARMSSVAIGDVAAESIMEGVRGSGVSRRGGARSRRGGCLSFGGRSCGSHFWFLEGTHGCAWAAKGPGVKVLPSTPVL